MADVLTVSYENDEGNRVELEEKSYSELSRLQIQLALVGGQRQEDDRAAIEKFNQVCYYVAFAMQLIKY